MQFSPTASSKWWRNKRFRCQYWWVRNKSALRSIFWITAVVHVWPRRSSSGGGLASGGWLRVLSHPVHCIVTSHPVYCIARYTPILCIALHSRTLSIALYSLMYCNAHSDASVLLNALKCIKNVKNIWTLSVPPLANPHPHLRTLTRTGNNCVDNHILGNLSCPGKIHQFVTTFGGVNF